MNDDIIAGRWKQLIGQATTRFGELSSADWTALGERIESFVGRLQERFGLAREQALAAVDEMSAETAAIAAQLDADRRAEECMDADYDAGPRLGLDNLAATAVPDPPPAFEHWLRETLAGLRGRVVAEVRQRPGWALVAAASLGYVLARRARPGRRAA